MFVIKILKIDLPNRRLFVNYINWSNKWDEWITDLPNRVAPLHAHTYYIGGKLKSGQRLHVRDKLGKWCEAFVIAERQDEVRSHVNTFNY